MDLLITVLILLIVAGLMVFIVDSIVPAPYNKPAKVVIAVIVILYLLGAMGFGLPVWRHR